MDLLIKAFTISLFCVGLRIASSPGMVLYFLRYPFDLLLEVKKPNRLNSIAVNILKPVIGCITCMASVYTILIEVLYYKGLNMQTILLIFVVASMNTIIYTAYNNLND